jgi:ElaA protein
MQVRWEWHAFDALTPRQLYAVLAARSAVFVVEQACAYQDLDGRDAAAEHLVAWVGDEVAAYARTFAPGTSGAHGAAASLGRVLTTARFRGASLGRELVGRALQRLDDCHPTHGVHISAQQYLERFYRSFGFATVSESYLEDGIPHVAMLRGPVGARP